MAKPSAKLADSLEALHTLQEKGTIAIRSADLSRTHREWLPKRSDQGVVHSFSPRRIGR